MFKELCHIADDILEHFNSPRGATLLVAIFLGVIFAPSIVIHGIPDGMLSDFLIIGGDVATLLFGGLGFGMLCMLGYVIYEEGKN